MNIKNLLNTPQWLARCLSALLTFLAYLTIPFSMFYQSLLEINHPVSSKNIDPKLRLKVAKYRALGFYSQDPISGFVDSSHGDSLLFSALASVGGLSVDLLAAREDSGKWHRQPLKLPQEAAASSISRDMLLGVMWWCWRKQRLDVAEALWQYGHKNQWVMGTGDVSRTLLEPGLQGTLALLIAELGGKKRLARFMPQIWNTGMTDYEAHLQVLHILLRGEVEGYIDSHQMNILIEQNYRQPLNPLFEVAFARYSDGDMTKASIGLLIEPWWPSDRLPKASDRSEPWLQQRDYGAGWLPGTKDLTHSGADFLFIASLI